MSEIQLTDCHYDVILLGTGLTNTILAAALAKQGKRVLHIDGHERYGSLHSSVTLKDFISLCETQSSTPASLTQSESQSSLDEETSKINDWRRISDDTDNKFQYHQVKYSSSFINPNILQSPSSSLLAQSRSFNIDLTPSFILSRSLLVELMIVSSVSQYVDFRAIDSQYICTDLNNGLQSVPVSRSQVFSSTLIDLIEKRLLMRFLQSIVPNHKISAQQQETANKEIEEFSDRPFIEFLQSKRLPPKLMDFILYAIAGIEQTQLSLSSSSSPSLPSSLIRTSDGVARTRLFLESIGRYSSGAFLFPIYGIGELPQAFSRLCAVNSGIYILRFPPEAIVIDKNNENEEVYKGLISAGQQLLTSEHFVVESEYYSSLCQTNENEIISCAVCILDSEIRDLSGSIITGESRIVFPPNTAGNSQPVQIFQVTQSVMAAPANRTIVYFSSPRVSSAEADLQPIIDYLVSRERAEELINNQNENETHSSPSTTTTTTTESSSQSLPLASDNKPRLLFSAFYERNLMKINPSQSLPKGVHITPSPSPLISIDSAVREAEQIFNRIIPNISLIEALRDEEKQLNLDTEQMNEFDSIINQSSNSNVHNNENHEYDESKEQSSPAAVVTESAAVTESKESPIINQQSTMD